MEAQTVNRAAAVRVWYLSFANVCGEYTLTSEMCCVEESINTLGTGHTIKTKTFHVRYYFLLRITFIHSRHVTNLEHLHFKTRGPTPVQFTIEPIIDWM